MPLGTLFHATTNIEADKFDYKMHWLKGMRDWLRQELIKHPKLVLMGDYNITFDDTDVWDPIGLKDTIHCTEEERYQLRALVALGLVDAYRLFEQPPNSYSWWDYRNMAFRRNRGLRIDHILVSQALKDTVKACVIDRAPRKNERPSARATTRRWWWSWGWRAKSAIVLVAILCAGLSSILTPFSH